MSFTARDGRYLALSVALLLLFVGGYNLATQWTAPGREAAPALEAPTHDGRVFRLADQAGQIVVLDFFATWCYPCEALLPELAQVAGSHPDVVWISVGIDANETWQDLQEWRARHAIAWPVAKAEPDQVGAWQVDTLAHVVVVDAEGRIVGRLVGAPQAAQIAGLVAKA